MKKIASAFPYLMILALILLIVYFVGSYNLLDVITGNAPIANRGTLVLERVQAMSLLTTTRFNYSVIVTSERDMPPILDALYGESLMLVAVGHVIAGIDLSQLTLEDVVEGDGTITITLPPPALQDCFLNEQESYIVSRQTGIFASSSPNLDNEARRYAVQQLRVAALEGGILDEVEIQARAVMSELANLFADMQAQVIIRPPDPNAPLPETCG